MGVPVQVRSRLPLFLKMMFGFITIGTNNPIKSKFFYDELLNSININNVLETERYIGHAKKDTLDKVEFYIMMPHNKKRQVLVMVQ